MKCREVQLWLLSANSHSPAPSGVRKHLYECARCRQERQRVLKLDAEVRHLPVPPGSAAARAGLWERIAGQPPPLPSPRRTIPFPRWLRWAAAAALFLSIGWLLTRPTPPKHVDAPTPRSIAEGHRVWIGPDEKAAVLRIARHDVRLAETTDAGEQLDVLADVAADLKDEAIRLVREGKAGSVPLLASLYEQVVRQGVVSRAAALPSADRPLLASIAGRLEATEMEVSEVAKQAFPFVAEMLRPLRNAARESAAKLMDGRQLVAAAPLAPGSGPAPLLTILVQHGLRLAEEADALRRADLCAELASLLAPAIVLLTIDGDADGSRELSACLGDLLEVGVADNLDRAADRRGKDVAATELANVRQRSAQALATLEINLPRVAVGNRAELQQAMDAVRPANERVREAGLARENRPPDPPVKPEEDRGKGPRRSEAS